MGPFDAIAFVALCVGLVKIFTGPVAKALADRVRGRTGVDRIPRWWRRWTTCGSGWPRWRSG